MLGYEGEQAKSQAHHLETEFYDRYYQPGAYHDAVRNHMGVWHDAR